MEILISEIKKITQLAIAVPTSNSSHDMIALELELILKSSESVNEVVKADLLNLLKRLSMIFGDTHLPAATNMFVLYRNDGTQEGASGMTGLRWRGKPIGVSCNALPGRCVVKQAVNGNVVVIADITGLTRFAIDDGYINASPKDYSIDAFKIALDNAIQLIEASEIESYYVSVG